MAVNKPFVPNSSVLMPNSSFTVIKRKAATEIMAVIKASIFISVYPSAK